jgi:transposase
MNPLYVPIPTEEQLLALKDLYRHTHVVRLRTRAQMVLLSLEQHLTAAAIAVIVREDDETVRRWLKRWVEQGIEGLSDRDGGGAPAKLTKAYEEELLACVRLRPRALGQDFSMWTLKRLAAYMAHQTGITLSHESVRQVLKGGGIVLSRPQHTVTSPDPSYLVKKKRSKRHVQV